MLEVIDCGAGGEVYDCLVWRWNEGGKDLDDGWDFV